VEGISELARLILDALTQHNVACRVMLTNDGEEALDYLLVSTLLGVASLYHPDILIEIEATAVA
jgi:enamine deaminase RidA (YjgF/YER057c/UK114 family)